MIPSFKIRQPLRYARHSREEAGLGIKKKHKKVYFWASSMNYSVTCSNA
jgi:hypothetical protein